MAGEIEDPLSYQADCLPTGSISFGRFEEESLSWERRSSFSHNRYLEEVKKYSRPGSVIEKKAYFEAHFKRKALSREASSDSQNGIENQTTGNEYLDDMNYVGEFEYHRNEETSYGHYDETPDSSDEQEYVVMEFERENEECSPFEFQIDPMLTNANSDDNQELEPGEVLQTQVECDVLPFPDTDTKVEIEQRPMHDSENSKLGDNEKPLDKKENSKLEIEIKLANEAENAEHNQQHLHQSHLSHLSEEVKNVDALHKMLDTTVKSPEATPTTEKQPKSSLNEKDSTVRKTARNNGQTRVSVAQNSRKISNEKASISFVKDFGKTPKKMEKESLGRTKTDRRSVLKVPSATCSLRSNLKPQDFGYVEKLHENKSGKDLKPKKVGTIPQTTHEKGQPEGLQSTSRTKRGTRSMKPDSKLNGPIFSFKSDERAEKRKEFYQKLEEKMHAKEVEMNQIQARTQEEIEAEIKQLRRSLNFKATPMPSFYLESVSRSSDGKTAIATRAKSPKSQSKSRSPGSRAGAQRNSPALSKTAVEHGSSCEPQNRGVSESRVGCKSDANSQTSTNGSDKVDEPRMRNRLSQTGRKTEPAKKDIEKVKSSNIVQQQQVDTRKGERVKTGRGDISKKAIKGVIGTSSGMGNLAVHVAS